MIEKLSTKAWVFGWAALLLIPSCSIESIPTSKSSMAIFKSIKTSPRMALLFFQPCWSKKVLFRATQKCENPLSVPSDSSSSRSNHHSCMSSLSSSSFDCCSQSWITCSRRQAPDTRSSTSCSFESCFQSILILSSDFKLWISRRYLIRQCCSRMSYSVCRYMNQPKRGAASWRIIHSSGSLIWSPYWLSEGQQHWMKLKLGIWPRWFLKGAYSAWNLKPLVNILLQMYIWSQ